jgi:hypothetical protein
MLHIKFIELVSTLKSLAFIRLHQSLFIVLTGCLSFNIFTIPTAYSLMSITNNPNFFLILPFISDIQLFLNSLTITSGEICCHRLEPLVQLVILHWALYCPHGVRTQSHTKSHSEYSCFKWSLKGLFTNTCSYKFITPGMPTRSVFNCMNYRLASSVKWSSDASNTSIPCFLNNTLGPLFHALVTSSPSVHLFIYLLVRHDYYPLMQLCLDTVLLIQYHTWS